MVNVRKDLNDMVKNIVLRKIKTRYNERNVCEVTLFNDAVIEFKDGEGLIDLFTAYKRCGKFEGLIKSRKLVEEEKTGSVVDEVVDADSGTYICVVYELSDGKCFRLFLNRPYIDKLVVDKYYEMWKEQQKPKKVG